jgi:hypothetical protein
MAAIEMDDNRSFERSVQTPADIRFADMMFEFRLLH